MRYTAAALLVIAAMAASPVLAMAQGGMGGFEDKKWPPKEPPGGDKEKKKAKPDLEDFPVVLRYYTADGCAPKGLKAAVERVKGVSQVVVEEDSRTVKVTFTGSYEGIAALENACAGARAPALNLSHGRLVVGFKAMKGSDARSLEDALDGIDGVRRVRMASGQAEMIVDFDRVEFSKISETASECGYEARFNTHAFISLTVEEGEGAALERELLATKGVLVVRGFADRVEILAAKSVGESAIRKLAEKAGVKLGEIAKK